MMSRLERYRALATHAYYGPAVKKLRAEERALLERWIAQHDHLDAGAWEMAANRMFLGVPAKPKNWTLIQELLSCVRASS